MGPLRFLLLPTYQALPWRWDLAQLELGCRFGWPRPGARQWAARARRIGVQFQTQPGRAALVFEGYTLVAALWSRGDNEILLSGPFVMPQFRDQALEAKLRSLLCARQVQIAQGVPWCTLRHASHNDIEASSAPISDAAKTSLG